MNENIHRINDIIKQVPGLRYDCSVGNFECHRRDLYDFAELIVRECVQTLQDNTPVLDENESLEDWNKGYIRAMLDCEHHIQEHFGVE